MAVENAGRWLPGRWILPLVALLSITGCSKQVALIPRALLFHPPARVMPTLSPDGTHLAWIASSDSASNIFVGTLTDTVGTQLTHRTSRRVAWYAWVDGGKKLLYTAGSTFRSDVSNYLVDLASGSEKQVFVPPEGRDWMTQARVTEISLRDPRMIAVSLNWREPAIFDLYRFNVETGELTLTAKGPSNLLWWLVDGNLDVRGYVVSEEDGGQSLYLKNAKTGRFRQEIVWTIDDDSGEPISFTPDGKKLYIYDSRGYNSTGLALYDPTTHQATRLVGDDRYDIKGVLVDPQTYAVQGGRILAERTRWVVFDKSIQGDIDTLMAAHSGNLNILSRTHNDSLWVVGYVYDDQPVKYYLYDRHTRALRFLFNNRNDLAGLPLAKMRPISYQARDGLRIEGYLTRPIGKKGRAPLVVYVHGGPWVRDYWGFNPEVQWFANRGYACLQVNYRGSTGYGKQFLNAGNREWGGKMVDDITDGVHWAVEQGIADDSRIAVFGGSVGGYLALESTVRTPNLYSAAVSIVGPSDLVAYLSSYPPVWNAYRTNLDRRVGRIPRYGDDSDRAGQFKDSTDWTPEDRAEIDFLRSQSPAWNTDAMDTPLLIAQGGRDWMVKQAVTDAMVARLRAKDLPVEYVVYKNEGHGLSNLSDRLNFYRRAEAFLAAYIGGRSEK